MPQKTSPFSETKYGWDYGESGWNGGMDENLLKFSYLFTSTIDSIVSSLPAAVDGTSYYLTADNRVYFAIGATWYSTAPAKWSTIRIKSSGDSYIFNGTSLIPTLTNTQISEELDSINSEIDSLGTASTKSIEYFASKAQLDVQSAELSSYTDSRVTYLQSTLVDKAQLLSATGGNNVGYQNAYPGSVLKTVSSKLSTVYGVDDAGAVGDNIANDTLAFQKVVENVGRAGGGIIRLSQGKTYYIPGTIILPAFVTIDLNGCTLRGNRPGGSTVAMFVTGYFNGSDVLVTNVGGPTDLVMLDGIRIMNGVIKEAYIGLDWTNANVTCGVINMTFTNCLRSFNMVRCWSLALKNIFSSGSSDFSTSTYRFEEAINVILLDQVRAVTDFAFEFYSVATGSASIVFLNCDVEGSQNRAFYFAGQFYGITWIGGYFEGIGGCVYDFSDVTSATVNWRGTFNFLSGVLLREPTSNSSRLDGEWDTSNAVLGAGQPGYPSTLNIQHPRNAIKFRFEAEYESLGTLPSYVNVGSNLSADVERISVRLGTGVGDVLSKYRANKGVIPLYYGGDVGRTFPNQVAFSTHSAINPGASATIQVLTKIVYRADTVFAKYRFTVVDSTSTYVLYGDIYGSSVKAQDATGKTVTVTNNGGFLQVNLATFNAPAGVYTCTGTVQLCT